MYCKKCGHEIKDTAKFCRYCGSQIGKHQQYSQNEEIIYSGRKPDKINENEDFPPIKRRKGRIFLIILMTLLLIIGVCAAVYFLFLRNNLIEKANIEIPTYSIEPGTYSTVQFVEIKVNDEENLTVYYTTDGTTPTKQSDKYTLGDLLQISNTLTLKSIAVNKNGQSSEVASADYIINQNSMIIETGEAKNPQYIFIIKDITWEQAQEDCKNRGGHLVTFDSDEEFKIIIEYIQQRSELDNKKFYIGGTRGNSGSSYKWVDANGNTYGQILNSSSHWIPGDPSFKDGTVEEKVMMMYYYDKGGYWAWADVPNDVPGYVKDYVGKIGYICEID